MINQLEQNRLVDNLVVHKVNIAIGQTDKQADNACQNIAPDTGVEQAEDTAQNFV